LQGFSAGDIRIIPLVLPSFSFSISELDQGFLAGFLEGEASFGITELNGGQSLSCMVNVRVRDDEQDLIEWMAAITGLGRLYRVAARGTSQPQIAWLIDTQGDCVDLAQLLARPGFHGRRAAELAIWSEAVDVWLNGTGSSRRGALRSLKCRLESARGFACGAAAALPLPERRRLRLGYISGFVAAEGSFGMSSGRPTFAIHLRKDDRPLLETLASVTVPGRIHDHTPALPLNPSSSWLVRAQPEMSELLSLLREADLPGRKRTEMETWAVAVDELQAAQSRQEYPRRERLHRVGEQLRLERRYRPSTRPLLHLARRDVRAESLQALQAWAEATPGRLSCGSYAEWRRVHPRSPTRNTVAQAFGGWHAAMDAAGLLDRAARRSKRAGGESARGPQRAAKRARVVEAVRRFETEHGRLPRAMEFFRWRFAHAPDAPSQAAVYKLFPGGWQAVLAAARADIVSSNA
jgi:hypothetical protein